MRRLARCPSTRVLCLACAVALCALVQTTGMAREQTTPAPATVTAPASAAAARPSPFIPPDPLDYEDHAGWTQLFNGRTLDGWDGNPLVWTIEDGAITAESTAERRVGTTYIIWRGGEPSDFELKLEIKAGPQIHSGIFYRSKNVPPAPRAGGAGTGATAGAAGPAGTAGSTGTPTPAAPARAPQAPPAVPADPRWNVIGECLDFDYPPDNNGNVQDAGAGRTDIMIGWRGDVIRAENGKRPRRLAVIGDHDKLGETIKTNDWNQVHIIARGNQLTHIINGQLMAVMFDDDIVAAKSKGVIALQIEGGVGKVSFRNIWLKQ